MSQMCLSATKKAIAGAGYFSFSFIKAYPVIAYRQGRARDCKNIDKYEKETFVAMFIKPSLTSPNSDSCHIHSPVQNASIKFPMRVTVGGGGLIWKFKQKLHIIAIVRHLNLSLRWQTDTFGIRKLFLLSLAWELCTSSKSKRDTFHYNNCQSFYSTSCANLSQTVNPIYQYVFTDMDGPQLLGVLLYKGHPWVT